MRENCLSEEQLCTCVGECEMRQAGQKTLKRCSVCVGMRVLCWNKRFAVGAMLADFPVLDFRSCINIYFMNKPRN